jgi:hypothetical protein
MHPKKRDDESRYALVDKLMKFKYLLSLLVLAMSFTASSSAEWVGKAQIKEVMFVKAGTSCSPNGGECMILNFEDGYTKCGSLSIKLNDTHIKHYESMALISLTSGKKFKVWTDSTKCNDMAYGFNDVSLY